MTRALPAQSKSYYADLHAILDGAKDNQQLFDHIVNAPFHNKVATTFLGLGVIVLLLVNKKTRTIDRIALSNTEQAKGAVSMSVKPFKDITVPVGYEPNLIVQAIKSNKPQTTADWQHLFSPDLTPQEARFNQAGAGIGCSVIYPLSGENDGGALIFSYFLAPEQITDDHHTFMQKYSSIVSAKLSF